MYVTNAEQVQGRRRGNRLAHGAMELLLLKCRLPSRRPCKEQGDGLSGTSNSSFPDQANKNAGRSSEFEPTKQAIL